MLHIFLIKFLFITILSVVTNVFEGALTGRIVRTQTRDTSYDAGLQKKKPKIYPNY